MGRKKKRNKSSKTEKTVISPARNAASPSDHPTSAAPRSIGPKVLPKKPSQLATYLLCGIMFTAGVLAQKTFDRWKSRQDLALRKQKQTERAEQGRVTDLRPNKF